MRLTIATWNINSVRLRLDLVGRLAAEQNPDIICLQETKCPDDKFPLRAMAEMGYPHAALNGQKGWHGVAMLSKLPFESIERRAFCDKNDCRHIAVTLGAAAGLDSPVELHGFYIPAGGDEPDPDVNPKFAHKLAFLDELAACDRLAAQGRSGRAILVGDLNVAPLEHDVWSHKQLLNVVSHTPVEVEKLTAWQAAGDWVDVMRRQVPAAEKLYTWWSYRAADWTVSNRGRRLDHVWASAPLAPGFVAMSVLTEARSWPRPSDHVPVLATFDL
ncbi:exodeoxyribonuclease III [Blastochloris tepida]|uniref:Exodeoxyribonuclease III n=1 Tax=Blastochloris tepida TaxID=2233851 RepID=A0A348G523_9HYPH|nr:exodeoxyribonuclease III [Blastochloris tepida]BBF94656.1 exodeoxyribonuclease III [Blastochloris tepida]